MEDRTYLSIDGIANGDIPAHAAAGWGFGYFKARPICSSSVIKNWGSRPIPLVNPLTLYLEGIMLTITAPTGHSAGLVYASFYGIISLEHYGYHRRTSQRFSWI